MEFQKSTHLQIFYYSQRYAAKVRRKCELDGSDDWKILVDFDSEQIVFPPEILSTSERPDIIIWSNASRKVLLIELTCKYSTHTRIGKFLS